MKPSDFVSGGPQTKLKNAGLGNTPFLDEERVVVFVPYLKS